MQIWHCPLLARSFLSLSVSKTFMICSRIKAAEMSEYYGTYYHFDTIA